MNAKNVIETLLEREDQTRYRLAKQLGVHESLLSRAYNGKSDPGFNEVSSWLDALGYTLLLVEKPNRRIDDPMAFSIDGFGKMLASFDTNDYDYLTVHRSLKQLIESYSTNPRTPEFSLLPGRIKDKNWRAFYAAAVSYLAEIADRKPPAILSSKINKISHPWCPIKKLGKSHTDFDETFAAYNVLLPIGELRWI